MQEWLVVETFGGWHSQSELVLTTLASQLASQTGGLLSETKRHLFQRLSVLLARGNSNMIVYRTPQSQYASANIDGDLDH